MNWHLIHPEGFRPIHTDSNEAISVYLQSTHSSVGCALAALEKPYYRSFGFRGEIGADVPYDMRRRAEVLADIKACVGSVFRALQLHTQMNNIVLERFSANVLCGDEEEAAYLHDCNVDAQRFQRLLVNLPSARIRFLRAYNDDHEALFKQPVGSSPVRVWDLCAHWSTGGRWTNTPVLILHFAEFADGTVLPAKIFYFCVLEHPTNPNYFTVTDSAGFEGMLARGGDCSLDKPTFIVEPIDADIRFLRLLFGSETFLGDECD